MINLMNKVVDFGFDSGEVVDLLLNNNDGKLLGQRRNIVAVNTKRSYLLSAKAALCRLREFLINK